MLQNSSKKTPKLYEKTFGRHPKTSKNHPPDILKIPKKSTLKNPNPENIVNKNHTILKYKNLGRGAHVLQDPQICLVAFQWLDNIRKKGVSCFPCVSSFSLFFLVFICFSYCILVFLSFSVCVLIFPCFSLFVRCFSLFFV